MTNSPEINIADIARQIYERTSSLVEPTTTPETLALATIFIHMISDSRVAFALATLDPSHSTNPRIFLGNFPNIFNQQSPALEIEITRRMSGIPTPLTKPQIALKEKISHFNQEVDALSLKNRRARFPEYCWNEYLRKTHNALNLTRADYIGTRTLNFTELALCFSSSLPNLFSRVLELVSPQSAQNFARHQ